MGGDWSCIRHTVSVVRRPGPFRTLECDKEQKCARLPNSSTSLEIR